MQPCNNRISMLLCRMGAVRSAAPLAQLYSMQQQQTPRRNMPQRRSRHSRLQPSTYHQILIKHLRQDVITACKHIAPAVRHQHPKGGSWWHCRAVHQCWNVSIAQMYE